MLVIYQQSLFEKVFKKRVSSSNKLFNIYPSENAAMQKQGKKKEDPRNASRKQTVYITLTMKTGNASFKYQDARSGTAARKVTLNSKSR